ncbi:MAG: hypothetical protein C0624_04520 [Desulfuromonas sp.]|nr:MAG: hypothetical protein C0624_04520 [Desulfuromonas sp.]
MSRALVATCEELAHINVDKLLFTFSRSRRPGRGGLLARITPLRGKAGSRQLERRNGRFLETWEYPEFKHEGREVLYLITLLLPRFFHLEPRERLTTLLHELWHISPACDGDIRRYPGARYAHGERHHGYDAQVEALTSRYLDGGKELPALLTLTPEEWQQGIFKISGLRIRRPRARLVARRKTPRQTL